MPIQTNREASMITDVDGGRLIDCDQLVAEVVRSALPPWLAAAQVDRLLAWLGSSGKTNYSFVADEAVIGPVKRAVAGMQTSAAAIRVAAPA